MFGVTFGEKHSFRDWGLIPKSRPVISPPEPKTIYIDIPESDGMLDLTEMLTGEVKYKNRNMTFEFNVMNERSDWTSIYSTILNYLHGQRLRIILDEDPNHFYMGRTKVDEWKSDKKTSVIQLSADVDPYKYEITSSLESWEWDTFNFEEDYIRGYGNLVVDGQLDFTVYGSRKTVIPVFVVDSSDDTGMQVIFENVTYNLQDGNNRVLNIRIKDGENDLTFLGNGTVSIDYRGGSL